MKDTKKPTRSSKLRGTKLVSSDTTKLVKFCCGQCKWFVLSKGRSSRTCRMQLGVDAKTPSCKDFEPRGPGLKTIDELKNDPFVDRIREILNQKKLHVDPALFHEVKSYLVFRKETHDEIERPVPERIDSVKDLQCLEGFFEEVQAYRDRVTEILMDLAVIHRRLKNLWLYSNAWCNEQPAITEGLRTADQREAAISLILKPLHDRYSYVKMFQKVCELADKNLASSHFALKELKETAEIHLSKLHNI